MEPRLEWGEFINRRPPLLSELAPSHDGKRLFLIKNGRTLLPQGPVVIKPFDGVTGSGWINVFPIHTRVSLASGLTSLDGIAFVAVVDLELVARRDDAACIDIAARKDSLYSAIQLLARTVASVVLRRFNYVDLFFTTEDANTAFVSGLKEAAAADLPYRISRSTFEVAAQEPGFDATLTTARSKVLAASQTLNAIKEDELAAMRRREAEEAEEAHRRKLEEDRARSALAQKQAERDAARLARKQDKLDEHDDLAALYNLFGKNVWDWLIFTHPALAAKVKNLEAQERIETARVIQQIQLASSSDAGMLKGINDTLRRLTLVRSSSTLGLAGSEDEDEDVGRDVEDLRSTPDPLE
jgi:hypothetical protein